MAPTKFKTITIGGDTVELALPASFAVRFDATTAAATHELRGTAACLALAWQALPSNPNPPRTQLARCKYDAVEFGGKVIDELCARGIPGQRIHELGMAAFNAFCESLPRETEVAAEEARFPDEGGSAGPDGADG